MKKVKLIYIIIFFVIALGLFIYLFREDNTEPSLSEQIDERLSAYTTDLEDSIVSISVDEDVVQYLCNWADSKGINCDVLANNAVVFNMSDSKSENKAGKDYVVICEYDSSNMLESIVQISTSLAVAKSVSKSNPLKICFIPREKSDDFQQTLKGLFTSRSQIICLSRSSENKLSISTGGWNSQKISKDIKYVKPQFNKAYKISISGLPKLYFNEDTVTQPSPIKTLGNLLAHFMSSQKLCELAEIYGQNTSNRTVDSAYATIVFNEESMDAFNEELDAFVESFVSKYEDDYPDLVFKYEEVACPDKVISSEDFEDIVGFLYSISDGVYKRDTDGNILAMSNIDCVELGASEFSLGISAYGYSRESLDELTESNNTFASLIGLTFNYAVCAPIYDGNIISDSLMETLQDSSKVYGPKLNFDTEPTSDLTPCSYICDGLNELPMVFVSFNEDGRAPLCKKLVMLLNDEKSGSAK